MGALGNAAAQALALAGVGHLILCDMDRIERSNLSRAPLFRESDIDRFKVEAAAEALRELAPDIQVDERPERLEYAVGLAELRDAELVLGCLDSRAARLELAGRCGLVRAPWIDGATGQWSGEVRPYLDPEGPCYGCGMDDAERAATDTPRSCHIPSDNMTAGATAPLSLIVGSQMALIALRYLMGLPTHHEIKVIDGVSGVVTNVRQERDPTCPFHVSIPSATLLRVTNASSVGALIAELGEGATPLAWYPFLSRVICRQCGYSDERTGRAGENCPHCGSILQGRSHLELCNAPAGTRLDELGIAPREILTVRYGDRLGYFELSGY
jgi:molybdopterin/thiamine biosynthesis adenylyltransferase